MARSDEQTNVRLPSELKEWLLRKAEGSRRSLTSEITVRLEESRKCEEAGSNATSAKGEAQAVESARASSTPNQPR